jgi:hypothetical protein
MLTLSRAPFGTRGNLGPTLISWISLVRPAIEDWASNLLDGC